MGTVIKRILGSGCEARAAEQRVGCFEVGGIDCCNKSYSRSMASFDNGSLRRLLNGHGTRKHLVCPACLVVFECADVGATTLSAIRRGAWRQRSKSRGGLQAFLDIKLNACPKLRNVSGTRGEAGFAGRFLRVKRNWQWMRSHYQNPGILSRAW